MATGIPEERVRSTDQPTGRIALSPVLPGQEPTPAGEHAATTSDVGSVPVWRMR